MTGDDRELWRLNGGTDAIVCVMISCCSGAELQLREGERILLRDGRQLQFTHRANSRYGRGRGLSADCLLFDEAGRDRFEDPLDVYMPMLAGKPNGQLVINRG